MSARRPCDACGGTGHEYRDVREYGHAYRMRRAVRSTCPACSGRGWQPVYMPVSDALADAETLLSAFWDEGGGAEWTDAPRGMLINALRASDYGEAAIAETCPAGRIQAVYAHAAAAARAAFRAVPGLREEMSK